MRDERGCTFYLLAMLSATPGGLKFITARARMAPRKFCEKFLGIDIMGSKDTFR